MELLANSGGRVDVLLERIFERLVRNGLEPRCYGLPLWDRGLGDVARVFIRETLGVSSEPITAVGIARSMGVLQSNPSRRRRRRSNREA